MLITNPAAARTEPLAVNAVLDTLRARCWQAEVLATVVGVPVETHDERFTTVTAARSLAEAGVTGRARRQVIDKAAAAVILQSWLDARRDPDLFIAARTDAAGVEGVESAIARCQLFMEAGADMAKPMGVDTIAEIKRVLREVGGPHMATLSQAARSLEPFSTMLKPSSARPSTQARPMLRPAPVISAAFLAAAIR